MEMIEIPLDDTAEIYGAGRMVWVDGPPGALGIYRDIDDNTGWS
ncbi:MAG: hypothetical protein ACRYG5_00050 [Janthinobacterium lividum]